MAFHLKDSRSCPAASSDRSDDVPLMTEMSLEIERLEAELRSATQKAARHEGQAEAYKQKAEAHKREAEALRQDVEALKQEAKAHKQEAARSKREAAAERLEAKAQKEGRQLLESRAKTYHAEAEVLKSDLARVKATLAEKLEAEEFEQKQCTVCLEHPAHVVALPCGHRCFCTNAECSAHVSLCPLCRTPMTGTLRVF
jgi:chromosome segregation ATPase